MKIHRAGGDFHGTGINAYLIFMTPLMAIFQGNLQWRSMALRGPGSTVTWGPSLPLPLPSSPAQHLPLPRSGLQIQLRGLGSAVSSPSGVWGGAAAEIEFGAF